MKSLLFFFNYYYYYYLLLREEYIKLATLSLASLNNMHGLLSKKGRGCGGVITYKQLFLKFSTYIVLIITNSQVTSKGGLELSIWNAMPCLDFGQDLTLKDL